MKKIYKAALFFHSRKLFLLPVVLFAVLFLSSLHKRNLVIYPGIDPEKISVYDDSATGGSSRIEYFSIDDTGISIDYTLQDAQSYPYTGIALRLYDDSIFCDLSSYDFFTIDLSIRKQQNVDLFFHNYIPGYTRPDEVITFRFLYRYFVCLHPEQTFTVPLRSFETPLWWYYHNKLPENTHRKEEFKRVAELIIQSGGNTPLTHTFGFTVRSVSVQRDIKKRAIQYGVAALGWLLLYFSLIFVTRLSRKGKKLVVFYEPAQLNNDSDDCAQRILGFIAKEYKNRNLTVNRVAEQVGVSPLKVTRILREKIHCSYKQHLNALRLAEAKRLLLQTDRNIVEIALRVGYNNVTHFNRIFKQIEGMTPREFRSAGVGQADPKSEKQRVEI